mmetsp:Transcript_19305/g.34893  ORF Transcript_19305/g.34893 Transcript_19305/m.34893 type:complete len:365 (-) Transcript_19305:154-1248(-)
MAAAINFHRITPAPDPTLKTTPLPRSSHGISALKDGQRLVLYGGENVARTPIADARQALWLAEKSDSGDHDWNWISPLLAEDGAAPSSRIAHSQAAVGDDVYIFGGRSGVEIEETALGDLWKLEIISADNNQQLRAKWTEVPPATAELPEARSFHKMIAISTDLYVFGGCGANGRLNDLWKFDTIGKEWTNFGCSHVLKGRGGPNILSLSSGGETDSNEVKIAVLAGFAGEETNDGHIFNNNSWEDQGMDGIGDMRKRSVCSFGSLPKHNKCIIFGGEVDPSNKGHEGAGNFERDVVLLDGASGALLEAVKPKEGEESSWPEARGWADATVGGEDIFYLFGGLAGNDTTPVRLDDLWECRFLSK